jgi:hypothetical protein
MNAIEGVQKTIEDVDTPNVNDEDVVRPSQCGLGSCMFSKNTKCLRACYAYCCRSRRTKDSAVGSSTRLEATSSVEDKAPNTLVGHGLSSDGLCESRALLLLVWVFGDISTTGALRLIEYVCTVQCCSVRVSADSSLFDDICSP